MADETAAASTEKTKSDEDSSSLGVRRAIGFSLDLVRLWERAAQIENTSPNEFLRRILQIQSQATVDRELERAERELNIEIMRRQLQGVDAGGDGDTQTARRRKTPPEVIRKL